MHALKTGLNADKFASIHGKSRTRSRSRLSISKALYLSVVTTVIILKY